MIAANAVLGFERARPVVETGMDYATVTGTGAHAEFWKRFQEKNVVPLCSESLGNGATNYSTADDYDVGLIDGGFLSPV
jgi:hypothetical protein